jgi:hypothetical protein
MVQLHEQYLLHPQTQFPGGSPPSYPIVDLVEHRNCWYSGDTLSSQLSELGAIRAVYIDKSVHISDTELLNVVLRVSLPLWS